MLLRFRAFEPLAQPIHPCYVFNSFLPSYYFGYRPIEHPFDVFRELISIFESGAIGFSAQKT